MNCFVTPFVARYRCTSSDLEINFTSLAAALKILALPDDKRVSLLQDVKRRNTGEMFG